MKYRKSTYSGQEGNACVEIARELTVVGIRDSKHEATELHVTPTAFARFLATVKHS